MPDQVTEKNNSFNLIGHPPIKIVRTFNVILETPGTDADAVAAVDTAGKFTATENVLGEVLHLEKETIRVKDKGGCIIYDVTVAWSNPNSSAAPGGGGGLGEDDSYPRFGYSTSSQEFKQTLALLPLGNPADQFWVTSDGAGHIDPTKSAQGLKTQVIGQQYDGPPLGVQVKTGLTLISQTYKLTAAEWTVVRRDSVSRAVGTVNDAARSGFAAGELLLVNVVGAEREAGQDVVLTYEFAVSKTENVTVPGVIVTKLTEPTIKQGVSVDVVKIFLQATDGAGVPHLTLLKDGWDYLEPIYARLDEQFYDPRLLNPIGIRTVRTYERTSFDADEANPPV